MTDTDVAIDLVDEPRWSDGPIRIVLTVTNRSNEALQVSVGYPIPAGLTVGVLAGPATARPVADSNARFVPLKVDPHATVTLVHELRRYIDVTGPGNVQVRVAFSAHATHGMQSIELSARRDLTITLASPNPVALTRRIDALQVEARTGATAIREAAVESISWLRTPSVIPALITLADSPDTARTALAALAAIDAPEALQALADHLPHADYPTTATALSELAAHRRVLPAAAIRALLAGAPPIQHATLSYLTDAEIAGFGVDVTPLMSSPNTEVVAAAKRYLTKKP